MKRSRVTNNAKQARVAAKRHARDVKHRKARAHALKWTLLRAPRALTFRNAQEETILFLRRIYEEVVVQDRRCTIDLSQVRDISFGAALALVAELNRATELKPGSIVRGILPSDPALALVLHEVGFIAATTPGGVAKPSEAARHLLKVHTGQAADLTDVSFLEDFLVRIFPPELMSERVRGRLKGAIKEALLNVTDHAYDPSVARDDACPTRRWWICGTASKKHGCYFVVYDLGVGIPATVPRTTVPAVKQAYEALHETERTEDYQLIKIAVTRPSSRTGLQGRGRGLPEMRGLIDRVGDGMLWITSGKGHYIYARGEEELDGGLVMDHSLRGTLVVWRFKVSEALDDAGADG